MATEVQELKNQISKQLLYRKSFNTEKLVKEFPPSFHNANKKLVYSICTSAFTESPFNGNLHYSRWMQMNLDPFFSCDKLCKFEMREDVFGYEIPVVNEKRGKVEWYLNFAHSHLFIAYAGDLLAQDELQVLEHPSLASLREALTLDAKKDSDLYPFTRVGASATPILIRGAQRICSFATDRNEEKKRPAGLYGNIFARAPQMSVRLATTVLNPPTVTNIIALEAPPGGIGTYRRAEIEIIIKTALAGFKSAKLESFFSYYPNVMDMETLDPKIEIPEVIVHTGNWGTGAYGGDKVLMAMLQLLAAHLAGIDKLIFHTFDSSGSSAFKQADVLLDKLLKSHANEGIVNTEQLIKGIHALGIKWGCSDGN